MTKNNQTFRSRPQIIAAIAALSILVVVAAYYVWPKKTTVPSTTNTDAATVTITTNDGIDVAATVKFPSGSGQTPAVIFLHEYGQDRHQWDPYLQKFVTAGFAVLSYDLRGFGESRLPEIPKDQATHLRMLPDDLPAVMKYLEAQASIDPARISIIGAGVGANVAFVASGRGDGLFRTVILSPIVSTGVLDGTGLENFSAKNVLGVAGTADLSALNGLMSKASQPQEVYQVDGDNAGVSLLSNETTLTHILTWLQS